jgi:hypothetical protein
MIRISVYDRAGVFAENKDIAAEIREVRVGPALTAGETVQLDFTGVEGATQSFIHALIADLIRRDGPDVLTSLSFHACSRTIRSIITIVVEYSQIEA